MKSKGLETFDASLFEGQIGQVVEKIRSARTKAREKYGYAAPTAAAPASSSLDVSTTPLETLPLVSEMTPEQKAALIKRLDAMEAVKGN